jgi:hypothetical protein
MYFKDIAQKGRTQYGASEKGAMQASAPPPEFLGENKIRKIKKIQNNNTRNNLFQKTCVIQNTEWCS